VAKSYEKATTFAFVAINDGLDTHNGFFMVENIRQKDKLENLLLFT
jgi:hypothetical protein